MAMRRSALRAFVVTLALAGCSTTYDTLGYIPDPEAIAQIKPGEQSRDQVQQILGTPSAISTFDDANWYYITRRTETTAFFQPQVVSQDVLVVGFDQDGNVSKVSTYSLQDARAIDPVTRTTPAPGKELSFIEQLVGNIGRFSGDQQPGGRR